MIYGMHGVLTLLRIGAAGKPFGEIATSMFSRHTRGETTHRGYCSKSFVEVFDRYLPKPEPNDLETTESIFTELCFQA